MTEASFATALIAGAASFASPCVLPLVPAYLSFISGASMEDLVAERRDGALARRVALRALAFVAGFSVVFIALGASASAVGAFLAEHREAVARVAGALVVVLGLHLTGLIPLRALYRQRSLQVARPAGLAGAFVVGLAFAFGWTPCVGPVLGSILALASTQESALSGVALLGAYSLGLGLPFIAAGVALNSFLRLFERVKRWVRVIEIATGVLLAAVGILIMTGGLERLSRYLTLAFGI